MIRNPPRSHLGHRLDKAEHLGEEKEKSSEKKQFMEEEEDDENITDMWETVLNLVEEN